MLDRMLMQATDMRICVSRDIVEIRRRRERTPESKLMHIPNAVDISAVRSVRRSRDEVVAEFGWMPENRLLLSVGRLVPAKDYGTLVEAVSILGRDFEDLRCLIVGEGSAEGDVRAAVKSFGVGDVVHLAGSRRDVPDLLAAADVFVLTSIRAGLPVSVLEAMAAGKPIVATAAGGIPDAIADGETGLLVEPRNPAAVADAIRRLLGDERLRRSLGEAAARKVEEQYSAYSLASRVGALYSELFTKKEGGA